MYVHPKITILPTTTRVHPKTEEKENSFPNVPYIFSEVGRGEVYSRKNCTQKKLLSKNFMDKVDAMMHNS